MTATVLSFPAPRPALCPPSAQGHRAPACAPDCEIDWAELVTHRAMLLRVARRQLRDADLAEDAVHDVFEAVLSGRAVFGGHSSLRTWLVGILRHKVTDRIREATRYQSLDAVSDADGEAGADGAGAAGWIESPQPGPAEQAEHRQMLARVLARIERLPASLADAVRWRLLEDEPTHQVCERLGISEGNLFVRLHRARAMLAG